MLVALMALLVFVFALVLGAQLARYYYARQRRLREAENVLHHGTIQRTSGG